MDNKIFVHENLNDIEQKNRYFISSVFNFFIVFCAVLAAICFIRGYVFFSVVVEGSSMQDTLKQGDLLVVNRMEKPDRFDVVVIKSDTVDPSETDEKMYIKRVIGLPGEEIWSENGVVHISYVENGETIERALDESYVKGNTHVRVNGSYLKDIPRTKIEDGHYFVMGDNREWSKDSRIFGQVPESGILGVVPKYVIINKDSKVLQYFIKFV